MKFLLFFLVARKERDNNYRAQDCIIIYEKKR